MVLWDAERPVYATLVSTVRDGLGDPGKTFSTPRGVFRIYQKHSRPRWIGGCGKGVRTRDVPW